MNVIGDSPFNTATMANIMAEQGHCSRAIAIYRELLDRHPENTEYSQTLERLERQRSEKQVSQLEPLLTDWIHLLLKTSRHLSGDKP